MVGEVTPLLPVRGGLLNLPFSQRPDPQFQELSPGLGVAGPAPRQSSGGLFGGVNLAEVGAGLSILQGENVSQAIGGLLASQRQAKQDALRAELLQRAEAREVAEFQAAQAAAAQSQRGTNILLRAAEVAGDDVAVGLLLRGDKEGFRQRLDSNSPLGKQLDDIRRLKGMAENGDLPSEQASQVIAQAAQLEAAVTEAVEGPGLDREISREQLAVSQGNLAVSRENTGLRKQELARQREADEKLDTAVTKIPQPDGSTRTVLVNKQDGSEIRELGTGFSTLTAAGELPASRADEVQASRDMLTGARTVVSRVRRSLSEAPARGGLLGTLKKGVQTVTGIASDFLSNDMLSGYLGEIANDITDGRTEREVGELFDPELPRNALAENQLAYALARARKPVGRINVDDIRSAKEDTKITGLFESADIKERMKAIDEEFERAIGDIDRRLKRSQPNPASGSPGGVPRFGLSPDGKGLIRID